jgi:hypothetical protein
MYVSVYVYVYVYVHVYVYVYACVCVHVNVCIRAYASPSSGLRKNIITSHIISLQAQSARVHGLSHEVALGHIY